MSVEVQDENDIVRVLGAVDYPGLPQAKRELIPFGAAGGLLPKGNGFPFRGMPPSPSFLIYRAMEEIGLKDLTDLVLSVRKRSFVTNNFIFNDIVRYLEPGASEFSCNILNDIIQQVEQEFHLEKKVSVLTFRSALRRLPQHCSPGMPYIQTHPGRKKGQIINANYKLFKSYWTRVGDGQPCNPIPDCAAMAQSCIDAPKVNKIQHTWAYPLLAISTECQFGLEFLQALSKQEIGHATGYGMEMMRGGMQWLHNKLIGHPSSKFFKLEYTNFDAAIPAWLIKICFQIIEDNIDFENEKDDQGNLRSIDPEKQLRKWRKLIHYFINTPIRLSDGTRIQTSKGIPSGSFFSNIIATMANMIIGRYLAKTVCGVSPWFDVYYGDDAFLAMPDHARICNENLAEKANKVFGLKINMGGTYWTHNLNNIKFFGYNNYDGKPVKNTIDLLAELLYPQQPNDDWAHCVSRALTCLLASAGNDKTVFSCVQAIVDAASAQNGAISKGLELVKLEERSQKFLEQLGVNPRTLSVNNIMFRFMSMPVMTCTKIVKNI